MHRNNLLVFVCLLVLVNSWGQSFNTGFAFVNNRAAWDEYYGHTAEREYMDAEYRNTIDYLRFFDSRPGMMSQNWSWGTSSAIRIGEPGWMGQWILGFVGVQEKG